LERYLAQLPTHPLLYNTESERFTFYWLFKDREYLRCHRRGEWILLYIAAEREVVAFICDCIIVAQFVRSMTETGAVIDNTLYEFTVFDIVISPLYECIVETE
jgi:hypothetical protein